MYLLPVRLHGMTKVPHELVTRTAACHKTPTRVGNDILRGKYSNYMGEREIQKKRVAVTYIRAVGIDMGSEVED